MKIQEWGRMVMWLFFAFGSALFSGLTSILAKCGIRKTDPTVATAIRTVVVLFFSWLMVFVSGSQDTIFQLSARTWLFLILSGLATGASWLCYFHALQLGDVNKVVPIDKSSTVLTMLLAMLVLGEPIHGGSLAAMVFIGAGTLLMIQKKPAAPAEQGEEARQGSGAKSRAWLFYAVFSAVFASLTAILGKIGIEGVESDLGTAIRTAVVLVMAWLMVGITGKEKLLRQVPENEFFMICLSGLATGAAWLCYYRALQEGPASVVVPVDKLSILVTIAFSWLVFHETLSKKGALGLGMITAGTLLMVLL